MKELRLHSISTMAAANQYLAETFLPDWQERFTVPAANPTDAHRPLTQVHNLAASLSHVESRTVTSDYTFQFQSKRYQIARVSACAGLKVRIPGHGDQDSGLMAIGFPGRSRSAFRADGDQKSSAPGMVIGMPGMVFLT